MADLNKDLDLEEEREEDIDPSSDDRGLQDEDLKDSKELELEIEDLKTSLARLQADFSNYKKRTDKEKQGTIDYANEVFITSLLPVVDNLEKALASQEDKEDGFYKGVEMIYEDLVTRLENNGLEEIASIDEDFDHNLHLAVDVQEVPGLEEGKVIDVLEKGYKVKDKVIRPSMVRVSK